MIKYFLSTADERSMRAALIAAGAASDLDGELIPAAGITLDVLGEWYQRTGGTDDAPEMTQIPGWFFNVYSEFPLVFSEVESAEPVTPWRTLGE